MISESRDLGAREVFSQPPSTPKNIWYCRCIGASMVAKSDLCRIGGDVEGQRSRYESSHATPPIVQVVRVMPSECCECIGKRELSR